MHASSTFTAPAGNVPQAGSKTPNKSGHGLSLTAITLLIATLVAVTWLVSRSKLFTPGSDLGYNLGLAGALMMLALLLYPLRKHWSWLARFGALRRWFWLHMFLGITGPMLILLHSTFTIGSLNAAVAFYSMLIVALSGVVGRFFYTKIHHGLYGRHASLQEHQARMGLASGEAQSKLHFAPAVEERLKAFEAYVTASRPGLAHEAMRFLTVGLRSRFVYLRSASELNRQLRKHARIREWDRVKLKHRQRRARQRLAEYLAAARDVAQFKTYERLFSAWHILHTPFVYLLIVSAIVHVVAVHMY
jgi:hypothetical protein